MIIQLLKDGIPVLTATSAHRHGNGCEFMPITYEGDINLLPRPMDRATSDIVESVMFRVALQGGLQMAGDYDEVRVKHNLKGFEQEARLK